MVDFTRYIPMIDAILCASNPDEVTPKKIRRALQELFAVDFEGYKTKLNNLIIERFNVIQEHPRVFVTKEKLLEQDKLIAAKLSKANSKHVVEGRVMKAKKKPKRKKPQEEKINPLSINVRKLRLSEPLQRLLGETELPRTQVVKKLWEYIKEHNLQNPEKRQEILCDDAMKPIFGDKTDMFVMNKTLVDHLFKIDLPAPAETSTDGASLPVAPQQ